MPPETPDDAKETKLSSDPLKIKFDRGSIQPGQPNTEIDLTGVQNPDKVRFPRAGEPDMEITGTIARSREQIAAQRAAAQTLVDDLTAQLAEIDAEDPFNKPFTLENR